ncbi:MAG: DUF4395 domain-containing protein [Candidatus Kariarchaeaceae archaeon]
MSLVKRVRIPRYPKWIDNNISRSNALVVFSTSLITMMEPSYSWLFFILFGDYLLRYIHPRISPLFWVNYLIGRKLLQTQMKPYPAKTKRLAIVLGTMFTGTISLGVIMASEEIRIITTSMLLFATFLEGFYGFCIGCKLYKYSPKVADYIFKKRAISA